MKNSINFGAFGALETFRDTVQCLKKKKRAQKQQGFGESSLALESQQSFEEAENSFSKDHEGKGCPASCGQSTQQECRTQLGFAVGQKLLQHHGWAGKKCLWVPSLNWLLSA